jgi:hypothetical protein
VRVHVSIRERSSRENVTCLGQGTGSIGSKIANPEDYSQCGKVEMNDMPSSNLTCRACPIHMKINAICAGHPLVILEARACFAAMKRDLQRNETVCNEHRANVGHGFFAWACHGFSTTASAAMKPARVTNALAVLLLLTPLLCGQNPDELLVVRLPAKHGYINQPGATPIPFPTVRGQTAAPGRARRCGSMAAGCSSGWRGNTCPGQAEGECKLGRQAAPLDLPKSVGAKR